VSDRERERTESVRVGMKSKRGREGKMGTANKLLLVSQSVGGGLYG